MLAIPYNFAIDMWSLGCILAELHTGDPLFAGETEHSQLALVMEINGLPPRVRNLLTKGYIQEQIQWKSSNYNI